MKEKENSEFKPVELRVKIDSVTSGLIGGVGKYNTHTHKYIYIYICVCVCACV